MRPILTFFPIPQNKYTETPKLLNYHLSYFITVRSQPHKMAIWVQFRLDSDPVALSIPQKPCKVNFCLPRESHHFPTALQSQESIQSSISVNKLPTGQTPPSCCHKVTLELAGLSSDTSVCSPSLIYNTKKKKKNLPPHKGVALGVVSLWHPHCEFPLLGLRPPTSTSFSSQSQDSLLLWPYYPMVEYTSLHHPDINKQ